METTAPAKRKDILNVASLSVTEEAAIKALLLDGISIRKIDGENTIFIAGNLAVQGKSQSWSDDGTGLPQSLLDDLPIASTSSLGIAQFDDSQFTVVNGVVTLISGAGGTYDHAALSNLDYANSGHTGFQPTITQGTIEQYFRGDLSLATFPSSMPASDVYAWAKEATKPSYTYSEVGAAAASHIHSIADVTLLQSELDGKTTEAYVNATISLLIGDAPSLLDTLAELSDALGDDPNFATTVATQISEKLNSADGIAYDSYRLGNVAAANYARTDIDETFNGAITFNDGTVLKDETSVQGNLIFEEGGLLNGLSINDYYHSGNSNLSTVDWTAKDLTAASVNISGSVFANGYGRTTHQGGGLVGGHNNISYSTLKTNPIYSIGTNFLPAEGTLGDMHGIGYTHASASFINPTDLGTAPNSWGMYVAADGNARIFLDGTYGNIHSKGNVYSNEGVFRGDLTATNGTFSNIVKTRGGISTWRFGSNGATLNEWYKVGSYTLTASYQNVAAVFQFDMSQLNVSYYESIRVNIQMGVSDITDSAIVKISKINSASSTTSYQAEVKVVVTEDSSTSKTFEVYVGNINRSYVDLYSTILSGKSVEQFNIDTATGGVASLPTGTVYSMTDGVTIVGGDDMYVAGDISAVAGTFSGILKTTATTASTSTTTGALISSGGLGVTGVANIGGDLRAGNLSTYGILRAGGFNSIILNEGHIQAYEDETDPFELVINALGGQVFIGDQLSVKNSYEIRNSSGTLKWTINLGANDVLEFKNASGALVLTVPQAGAIVSEVDILSKGKVQSYSV